MLRNPDYKGVNIVKENERDVFRLISGDPNIYEGGWDTPQYMKNAVIKAIEDGYNMYPHRIEGLDSLLIESIIRWEKRINNMNYSPNNIIPTQGVAGAIRLAFPHLMKLGDDLVLTDPTYIPYKRIGNKIGKARFFRTIEDEGWIPDIDDLRKKITQKSCAIIIIHPQNPTGCLYNKKNLKAIIDVAGENGIPLISDEIYGLFTYGNDKFYPLASVARDVPVITMNSISKHYVATGWRIGHISIHDPNDSIVHIKEQMKKDQSIAGTIPTPLIYGAMAAFDGSIDHIDGMKKKLVERRNLSYKRLNEIPSLSSTKPQATFFIFPKIDSKDRWKDDLEFTRDLRIKARIAVNPGSFYGGIHSVNHFRVPYLPGIAPLNRIFDRLEEFMRKKDKTSNY
jgi:aspartate/methionine/tyrosine aminotransferase